MIAKNYKLLSKTGTHEDRHIPVSVWGTRKSSSLGRKPAKYRRNDEVRKTPLCNHHGHRFWQNPPMGATNKTQQIKSQGRYRTLHSLKLSAHKTLPNYKGKQSGETWESPPEPNNLSGHPAVGRLRALSLTGCPGRAEPRAGTHKSPVSRTPTAPAEGWSPKGWTVIFKNIKVTRQTDWKKCSKLKKTRDNN